MSMRAAMLCALVLALGCTDQPSTLDAVGGDAAIPLSKHDHFAPNDDTNTWIVRRMKSRAASSQIAMRDAGGKSSIVRVPRISADGGVIPPRPEEEEKEIPVLEDAGQTLPADEEDAGNDDPPPCDAPNCLCKQICQRGLMLECPSEDSLDVCIEQCSVIIPDCYDQLLRVLRCSVKLPDAAYSCDPDLEVFLVDGCTAENNALDTCSLL
jgi:hypothetical protein